MSADFSKTGPAASARIIVVGGGIAGLSASLRLAEAGFPVTVLEASCLGEGASMRNQGWLHSGAWFAPQRPELARMCHESLQHTLRFCPEAVAENSHEMMYLLSQEETDPQRWTAAWDAADIPYQHVPPERLFERVPGLAISQVQHAFQLPDRSIRVEALLMRLAQAAESSGVEIRSGTSVARLLYDGNREEVRGVETSLGEKLSARLVILAGNAKGGGLVPDFGSQPVGPQGQTALVALKTHLTAVKPMVSDWPLCVVDADGLNHLPHRPVSLFGTNRWLSVRHSEDQQADPAENARILAHIHRLFPDFEEARHKIVQWAGTTIQAMHVDDLDAAQFPCPLVVDHQQEPHQVDNLLSIFPGRATLWASLAEATREAVVNKLGGQCHEIGKPVWERL